MSEEGGTRITRNPPPVNQQQQPQMSQQEYQARQQQYQQQQQQQQPQQERFPQPQETYPKGILKTKSAFGNISMDSQNFKNSLLVVIIFLLLNSKIIWKQIIQLPMMGSVDPSIVALIVNSILAGIVYYFISNYLKS
jgi:hypothetical protein